MASMDVSKYAHSPVHKAVILKDSTALKKIICGLPRHCDPSEVRSESVSLVEEEKADAISAVIDRRDVPNRDTPLHLAVKLGDERATEMLMLAGADWSLQNEQGWSALQEAICNREEAIARIIVRHYQPLAWAKWCRRLPRLVGTMRRMKDFYMEINFNFESTVIPFISRIAPSDTYKIWKRGANLRADMTLAGFDGFKIQRSDQSVLFLGDGSEDGKVPPGSLLMISHKDKEIMNSLDNAGAPTTDAEVQAEVAAMSQTNIFRPGIDVTQAVLLPQLTWRKQEKTEVVGHWKAKVYDMHNVVVSIKSRNVPGAVSDDELFNSCNETETENGSEELDDILTEEERRQLEAALKMDSSDSTIVNDDGISSNHHDHRDIPIEDGNTYQSGDKKQERRGWFSSWSKRDTKTDAEKKRIVPPRSSLCVEKKVSDLLGEPPSEIEDKPGRHSMEIVMKRDDHHESRRARDNKASSSTNSDSGNRRKDGARESEYKKGLRPVLWLSPDFLLQTEELLPLLDILANKVKAIRRLRELLTTKLPRGTFPVKAESYIQHLPSQLIKLSCINLPRVFFLTRGPYDALIDRNLQVAIPIVPTIRVLVTFTKLEELQPLDEFSTPPSSPTTSGQESPAVVQSNSSSWFQWIKTPYNRASSAGASSSSRIENIQDPFVIPADYVWVTSDEKKKRMQEKNKLKKAKSQK